jgi:putative ABC transport system permease protein
MFQLSIRGIRSHLGRFVLTGLAIAMSVGFLTGTFILFPTTTKMIDGMIGQSVGGVDVVIRRQQLDENTTGASDIQPNLADQIRALPGVTAVQPMRYEASALSLTNGTELGNAEVSTWATSPFNVGTISQGREPLTPNETAIDRGTAKAKGLRVGDTLQLSIAGSAPQPVKLVGLVMFGKAESVGGLSVFVASGAMESLTQTATKVDWLLVAGSGAEVAIRQSIQTVLPEGLEALTGDEYRAEQREGFASQVAIFKGIIGGFAAVSFLVGAFLIANTFSIVVAQRAREVALLRAIGALRRQVKRMVLIEAFVVGTVCSVIGLGVGILMAKALISLLKSSTGMPDPGLLVMPPSAFAIGMLVGITATVGAAWMPVRRGTKVEPVAALRNDDIQLAPKMSRIRTILGVLMIFGAVVLALAPGGDQRFVLGVGASLFGLIGVALVAPTLVISFFGLLRPLLGRGAVGELAIDGARRSPRRTASTAAALMIGLGLVTGALVLVNSMKVSIGGKFDRQVGTASAAVSGWNLTDSTVTTIASVPGVKQVQTVAFGRMLHKGVTKDVTALSTSGPSLFNLEVAKGVGLEQLKQNEVLIYKDVFDDGIQVGSTIDVVFRQTGKQQLKVVGVFGNNTTTSNYIVSTDTARANVRELTYSRMLVSGEQTGESGADALVKRIELATAGRGVEVQTIAAAAKANNAQMDGFLGFIMGLLGVSMVIALLGVVNTMALAVLERTRELGMLRAVGMTRRQIRQVIRREAAAVSVFGAALGLVVGLPIGAVLVRGLSSIGVDRVTVPVSQVAMVTLVALLAGVIAAIVPARRAAKLDVLAAISHT